MHYVAVNRVNGWIVHGDYKSARNMIRYGLAKEGIAPGIYEIFSVDEDGKRMFVVTGYRKV